MPLAVLSVTVLWNRMLMPCAVSWSPTCEGASSESWLQCRRLTAEPDTCPLAQSVERIYGKENPGPILLVR
jgi:hypothetical protein